jgi:tetratricopeptide (TPR) repeat protein
MKRLSLLLSISMIFLTAGAVLAADLKDVYEDAQRSFRHGDYEGAISGWTRVLNPEPGDTGGDKIDLSSVYFNRGLAYKQLRKLNEAVDDFSMVVGLDPNDAEAYYQRGGCYNMLGFTDKGDADVLKACELSDTYCTAEMLEQKKKENEQDWRGY